MTAVSDVISTCGSLCKLSLLGRGVEGEGGEGKGGHRNPRIQGITILGGGATDIATQLVC